MIEKTTDFMPFEPQLNEIWKWLGFKYWWKTKQIKKEYFKTYIKTERKLYWFNILITTKKYNNGNKK